MDRAAFVVSVFFLAACGPSGPTPAEQLVGTWEYLPEGADAGTGARLTFKGDGTWDNQFPRGGAYTVTQDGTYSVSGDVLTATILHHTLADGGLGDVGGTDVSVFTGSFGVEADKMIGPMNNFGSVVPTITYVGGDTKTLVGTWTCDISFKQADGTFSSDAMVFTLKGDGSYTWTDEALFPGTQPPPLHQAGGGSWSLSGADFTLSGSSGKVLHSDGTYGYITAGHAFRPWVTQLGPPKSHRRVQP